MLVLVGPTDKAVETRVSNVLQACRSARLCVTVHNVGTEFKMPHLDDFSCVVMATKNRIVPPPQEVDKIEHFVRHGGGLIGINPPACPGLATVLGLHTPAPKQPERPDSFGTIRFNIDLFPGLKGLELDAEWIAPFARYSLDERAGNEVVAEVDRWGAIGWRRIYGEGRVFVWNCNLIDNRTGRGLFVQSILDVHAVSARAIANVGVVWVDDFPAGITDRHAEPISSEFGFSYLRFLDEVWFPDMLELAETFGISYSFAIPFTYNDQRRPPFEFAEWELERKPDDENGDSYSVYFAKKAAQHGELCLHGAPNVRGVGIH